MQRKNEPVFRQWVMCIMAGNRRKNEIAPVPFLPESHSADTISMTAQLQKLWIWRTYSLLKLKADELRYK